MFNNNNKNQKPFFFNNQVNFNKNNPYMQMPPMPILNMGNVAPNNQSNQQVNQALPLKNYKIDRFDQFESEKFIIEQYFECSLDDLETRRKEKPKIKIEIQTIDYNHGLSSNMNTYSNVKSLKVNNPDSFASLKMFNMDSASLKIGSANISLNLVDTKTE